MMEWREIGTEQFPLRISSLPMLVKCPARIGLQMMEAGPRTSSPASDTGTAAHYAISTFYQKGVTADAAIEDMRASVAGFPLADFEEAEKFARNYFKDPRNDKDYVREVEKKVRFRLAPHPDDPTGQEIWIEGTTDQIRRTQVETQVEVHDYKTGKADGMELLYEHMFQLAGYTKGVEVELGVDVIDSAIIRARGYQRKDRAPPESQPPGVFFHSCMGKDIVNTILYRVRHTVAALRKGEALFGPGSHCLYCPFENPSVCIPKGVSLGLECHG